MAEEPQGDTPIASPDGEYAWFRERAKTGGQG